MILAAGKGERARPLTDVLPKALINVAGRTLLDWNLNELYRAGIHDITVAIGYRASMIEDYLQSHRLKKNGEPRITVTLVPDYDIGPLRTALTAIETFVDEVFLITPVDAVVSSSLLSDMLDQHSRAPTKMMLAVDFARKSGTQVYVNSDGLIVGLGDSTPTSDFIVGRSAMLLIASRTIIEYCRSALLRGETRLVPILNQMIDDGLELTSYSVQTEWFDVDTLSDVLMANSSLLRNMDTQASDIGIFVPDGDLMEIGDRLTLQNSDIFVDKDVLLRGPLLLSHGCRIEDGCRMGPNVTVCPSARVSKGCELINTIVHDNSIVPAKSRIENAVVYNSQIYCVEL